MIHEVRDEEAEPISGDAARLTEGEAAALAAAGAWYVNFHGPTIAEQADDESAYAIGRRARFRTLISGLRKLGVQLPDPTIHESDREAA